MTKGIFIGLSESELLAIRSKAVALITEGKTTMSYSPGDGSSFSKQFSMKPEDMLAEAKHALQILDPATYGKRTTVLKTNWGGFENF
jgi:uncharacterized protein with von Willebrand factor type A (vWA) domain